MYGWDWYHSTPKNTWTDFLGALNERNVVLHSIDVVLLDGDRVAPRSCKAITLGVSNLLNERNVVLHSINVVLLDGEGAAPRSCKAITLGVSNLLAFKKTKSQRQDWMTWYGNILKSSKWHIFHHYCLVYLYLVEVPNIDY